MGRGHLRRAADTTLLFVLVMLAVAILANAIEARPQDMSTLHVLEGFVLPGLGLIALLAAFRLPPGRRINLAVLLVTTGIMLYVGEAGLRFALDRRAGTSMSLACPRPAAPGAPPLAGMHVQNCRLAAAARMPFDARTKLQVIEDLERRGVDVWPAVVPRRVMHLAGLTESAAPPALPLGGISRVETIYCNETGEHAVYHSDEFGFRNPSGSHDERPVKVVVIGDSFAAGSCVADGHTVGGILRRTVGTTITLANDGNGPLTELALLREYAAPLQPDLVAWLFFEGNDLGNLSMELDMPALRAYLDPAHRLNLRARQAVIDSIIKAVVVLERQRAVSARDRHTADDRGSNAAALSGFVRLTWLRRSVRDVFAHRGRPDREPDAFDEQAFEQVILHARQTISSWGGEMLFVYLPAWERFAEMPWASPHRARLLATVRRAGIPAVDVTEVFERQGDPLSLFPFRADGHYTNQGYALVAEAIVEWMDSSGASRRNRAPAGRD